MLRPLSVMLRVRAAQVLTGQVRVRSASSPSEWSGLTGQVYCSAEVLSRLGQDLGRVPQLQVELAGSFNKLASS